jgi:AcrR family transcriptional regulator
MGGEAMTVAKRREREQSMRRELIMNTARQLFAEKGVDSTTVEEIAARAELGKGTIYSYFQSKEQIYIAILESGLDDLRERMDRAMENPASAVDALYKMYDVFIEFNRERKGFVESLFLQADQQSFFRLSGVVGGLKNRASVWNQLVAKVLQWGIERGEFKRLDVNKLAQVIVGMIIGLIIQNQIVPPDTGFDSFGDVMFEMTLEGIRK